MGREGTVHPPQCSLAVGATGQRQRYGHRKVTRQNRRTETPCWKSTKLCRRVRREVEPTTTCCRLQQSHCCQAEAVSFRRFRTDDSVDSFNA